MKISCLFGFHSKDSYDGFYYYCSSCSKYFMKFSAPKGGHNYPPTTPRPAPPKGMYPQDENKVVVRRYPVTGNPPTKRIKR